MPSVFRNANGELVNSMGAFIPQSGQAPPQLSFVPNSNRRGNNPIGQIPANRGGVTGTPQGPQSQLPIGAATQGPNQPGSNNSGQQQPKSGLPPTANIVPAGGGKGAPMARPVIMPHSMQFGGFGFPGQFGGFGGFGMPGQFGGFGMPFQNPFNPMMSQLSSLNNSLISLGDIFGDALSQQQESAAQSRRLPNGLAPGPNQMFTPQFSNPFDQFLNQIGMGGTGRTTG